MKYILPITIITISALYLSGCGKNEPPKEEPIRPVIVQRVGEPLVNEERSFTGVIKAAGLTTLGFESPGRILEVIAKEGQHYKSGDVLVRLDVSNLEADERRAAADARQANEELKRIQQLFESGNASRAQFDTAIAAQQSTKAGLEIANKKVNDGVLKMPYDGVIENVLVDVQNVVSVGTQAVSIQGNGSMKMEIGVPSEVVNRISVNMPAKVKANTFPAGTINAFVEKVFPQATQNGTYPVTLVLKDPGPELRSGMDAEAQMEFKNENGVVLLIELTAIVASPDGQRFVWVASGDSSDDATVKRRLVKIGELRGDGQIEVLSGLNPGEQIVIRGARSLKEDLKVKIRVTD